VLFINGSEVIGEAQIWAKISQHVYRPTPFLRSSDRWQAHARTMPTPNQYRPCHTEAAASA
jgi:hypothetical protein